MELNLELGDLLGSGNGSTAVADLPANVVAEPKPVATSRRSTRTTATVGTSLVFDLETIPDYSRKELFGLDPIPEAAARTAADKMPHGAAKVISGTVASIEETIAKLNPCNEYLDQMESLEKANEKPRKGVLEAIAACRNQDAARLAQIEAQRKKMALRPEMNSIVAMGWRCGRGDGDIQSMVVGQPYGDISAVKEVDILNKFWQLASMCSPIIGFNILSFDLPTLFVRSMILGVKPLKVIDLKPWGNDCIDLFAIRNPKGNYGEDAKDGTRRLKWVAPAMGIEVPAGDVDGSQTEEMWRNDPAKLGEYVRSDVAISLELYSMYRGFFFR